MNRARLIGGLLTLILLACAVVIFLDQKGAFGSGGGGSAVSTPATPGTSGSTPVPQPSNNGGYGDLK